MLFRRSKPEMVAVRPSAPPLDELDSALDTIAQILRSIGKNAIGSEERSSQAVRAEYDGWAQKLLIGNREDEAGGARDYRGVRRFVGQERSEEHSYVTRTLSSLREAVSEFGRAVTTGVSADRREDGEVRTALGGLMDALGGSDPDRIAREATAVAGVVQRALDSRARRQEQQIDRLRSHVRVLQEQLEAARHQATKDKVTGLFNSAAFMDHLERVTELSLLMDREPILVLVHVDAFDRLFDEHGQERADTLMRTLSDVLVRHFLRREDLLARLEGERFAVLVPDSRPNITEDRAEAVRKEVAGNAIELGSEMVCVTVSVSLAIHGPGETPDAWLARADNALYGLLRAGGNGLVKA
ncbi:MAG: GGDEF domain-containing protein [Myxococcales bacterium]|nr:GGDEF domain-containing protein [Myxococcales bacterium]MCB9575597.1 GGDEF domain-containing protein [Polyangiaceae bacterium]